VRFADKGCIARAECRHSVCAPSGLCPQTDDFSLGPQREILSPPRYTSGMRLIIFFFIQQVQRASLIFRRSPRAIVRFDQPLVAAFAGRSSRAPIDVSESRFRIVFFVKSPICPRSIHRPTSRINKQNDDRCFLKGYGIMVRHARIANRCRIESARSTNRKYLHSRPTIFIKRQNYSILQGRAGPGHVGTPLGKRSRRYARHSQF